MDSNAFIDCLKQFQEERDVCEKKGELSISIIGERLVPVAQHLIYCGHFEVKSGGQVIRCIYPDTVEFYYHEEGCQSDDHKISDYIVYHRNKDKNPDASLPAYPLGSINTHVSGIDITFEDQKKHPRYRASALIRAFHVEEKVHASGLQECPNPESRSTYIYDYLFMGLPLNKGFSVEWVVDRESTAEIPERGYRVNVHAFHFDRNAMKAVKHEKKKYPENWQDKKGWAFSRYPFEPKYKLDSQEEK